LIVAPPPRIATAAARSPAEVAQAGGDGAADALRVQLLEAVDVPGVGGDPHRPHLAQQLVAEERVPRHLVGDRGPEGFVGVGDVDRDQGADRLRAERVEGHRRHPLAVAQVGEQAIGTRLSGAGGEDERDWHRVDPPAQVVGEAQALRVGPVEVVDDQQDRRHRREVRGQPVEPVQDREGIRRAALRPGAGAEERPRQGRGTARRFGPLARDFAEEPDHDAPRQPGLDRVAARGQHPQPVRPRPAGGDLQQARLADPGRALEEEPGPGPGFGRADRRLDPRQLLLALQQAGDQDVGGVDRVLAPHVASGAALSSGIRRSLAPRSPIRRRRRG
jgi:hypothetical protein